MDRHEADSWPEGGRLVLGGVVLVAARVNVWSYDGKWGGEAVLRGNVQLAPSDTAALVLAYEDTHHPVEIRTVSRRSANETTVHFTGLAQPPFSPHAVLKPFDGSHERDEMAAS
jgi:hypothetical protein